MTEIAMTAATPGVSLGALAQIAITVADVARATVYYRDTLGMRQLPIPAPHLAFFDCGGIRLMLSRPEGRFAPGGGTVLYFRVADIRQAHGALTARGVRFLDEPHVIARMHDVEILLAAFEDPDGNHLALMSEARAAA
jgi:catechol 2,3-dioxygenase-like lactoylglutathione lyase family enzyme